MSIPQPDLFTNPNDLQRNTLQLQTRIVQIAWTDSWKIWNPGSSQIRPRFWHKYSWKWVLWANGQTGGGAKSALALDWIDLERFWQCKSLNWHLCESKKVCKYGATMHIEGSSSLWRKNYPSRGLRSPNPLQRVGWGTWLDKGLPQAILDNRPHCYHWINYHHFY